jgi:DNA polymerase-3 subunit epsilon
VAIERMVDTLILARRRHPGAKHSLDALCTRYGIDRSHRVLHGALLDAELLAQVYVELTGGRQIGLALAAEVGAVVARVAGFVPRIGPFRPARPHGPNPDELARHKAFLETLESPLWAQ